MNGDLGNLLTGEMGEAETRFAQEDFAGDYGRRVMSRVRTRRTVRAAGMSGGTMLTAGALAIGGTHVPWGALGAAGLLGVGGSDCVTPSPSSASPQSSTSPLSSTPLPSATEGIITITSIGSAAPGEVSQGFVSLDGETGATSWVLNEDDHGRLTIGFASGGPQPVVLNDQGFATIDAPDGTTLTIRVIGTDSDGGTRFVIDMGDSETYGYQYDVPARDQVEVTAAASPTSSSDDCVTLSPTPSGDPSLSANPGPTPDPSLAAKPEDVIGDNPFECGFEFPTDSYRTDDLWIDGSTWLAPSEVNPGLNERLDGTVAIPSVTVHDATRGQSGGRSDAFDPALTPPNIDSVTVLSGEDVKESTWGSTFVAASQGKVVGTITNPWSPEDAPALRHTDARSGDMLTLMNPEHAFTACPGVTLGSDFELYAIAGKMTMDSSHTISGPDYVWLKVTKP